MRGHREELEAFQEEAFEQAAIELLKVGLKRADAREWVGTVRVDRCELSIRVCLPEQFPYVVPEVYVEREALSRRIPHVERNGKLCLLPNTGILIDSQRPRDLVKETWERARKLLSDGLKKKNSADFYTEFQAYWSAGATQDLGSICSLTGPTRQICVVYYYDGRSPAFRALAADDLRSASRWLRKRGMKVHRSEVGFLYKLAKPLIPPDFDEVISVEQFFQWLRSSSSLAMYNYYKREFDEVCSSFSVLITMPTMPEAACVLFAVRVGKASLSFSRDQFDIHSGSGSCCSTGVYLYHPIIERLQVSRLDPDYLLPRSGASSQLQSKTVVVIGCGAVGSFLATHLALMGVGRLCLIDPECLTPSNIHRHTLGIDCVSINKALALKCALESRFPHIEVDHRANQIENVLRDERELVLNADVVALALGDETLELMLNDILRYGIPRIHAWVEPLGIGGHVLATGVSPDRGCFRCLFGEDPEVGLHNRSAFAGAGQPFQRTFAGCAGTFTPFASGDADQTALIASRLISDILAGRVEDNVLVSWFGDPTTFLAFGFELSSRADLFQPGEQKSITDFRRSECICRGWTEA